MRLAALIAISIMTLTLLYSAVVIASSVNIDVIESRAEALARRNLKTKRCQIAFSLYIPGITPDTDLVSIWDEEIDYAKVEIIPGLPYAIGATSCDYNAKGFVYSTRWASWGREEMLAQTFIHEMFHLLRCPEIFKNCDGKQRDCRASFMANEEVMAYKVAKLCMGIPEQKTKEKK